MARFHVEATVLWNVWIPLEPHIPHLCLPLVTLLHYPLVFPHLCVMLLKIASAMDTVITCSGIQRNAVGTVAIVASKHVSMVLLNVGAMASSSVATLLLAKRHLLRPHLQPRLLLHLRPPHNCAMWIKVVLEMAGVIMRDGTPPIANGMVETVVRVLVSMERLPVVAMALSIAGILL